MISPKTRYADAQRLAHELKQELKRLHRWDEKPLPAEKFENMAAFGSNNMTFEQWLQFVLIPRINEIVTEQGEFPDESMLASYAIRNFDGDPEADAIHDILYKLDDLINGAPDVTDEPDVQSVEAQDSVSMGSETIPAVLFNLAEVLPQCTPEDIESHLQTFDTFLSILSPKIRSRIIEIIRNAAIETKNQFCKQRLEQAVSDLEAGHPAAAPYDHEGAMKKYMEDHKKSFPDQSQ